MLRIKEFADWVASQRETLRTRGLELADLNRSAPPNGVVGLVPTLGVWAIDGPANATPIRATHAACASFLVIAIDVPLDVQREFFAWQSQPQ